MLVIDLFAENSVLASLHKMSVSTVRRLYNGNPVGQQFGPKCNRGDRIGCGIYADTFDAGLVTVFFTKNGKEVSLFWNRRNFGSGVFVCITCQLT